MIRALVNTNIELKSTANVSLIYGWFLFKWALLASYAFVVEASDVQ